jgi:hypothetical protein
VENVHHLSLATGEGRRGSRGFGAPGRHGVLDWYECGWYQAAEKSTVLNFHH